MREEIKIIRDIIDRIERPRAYAGDWASDVALRIVGELKKADFVIERRGDYVHYAKEVYDGIK